MQSIDLVLLVVLVAAAVSGWRRGFAVVVLGYAGLLGGLALGAWLATRAGLVLSVEDSLRRLLIGMVVFFLVASVCHVLGIRIGQTVRNLLPGRLAGGLDNAGGAVVAAGVVAIALWFVGLTLAAGPVPSVSRAVTESAVLGAIDRFAPRPPAALAELRRLLDRSPFPEAFANLREPISNGPPPPIAANPRLAAAVEATVKIQGRGCGGVLFGSGFPVAQGLVVTNAHVVAGSGSQEVITVRGVRRPATVVWFDPGRDLALLRVGGLGLRPLAQAESAPAGSTGAVVGYPGGGSQRVAGARVIARTAAQGRDIYSRSLVRREIYMLRAVIRRGNSGGPLVNQAGRAVGVVFAASTVDGNQGYALTMTELRQVLRQGGSRTRAVPTGACAA